MKWFIRVSATAIFAIALSPAWSQATPGPAEKEQRKSPESFMDFELNQINPQNMDYSCEIDEIRNIAIHEMVGRIDSWAVLVAFALLVLSFMMLMHQHQELKRREIIAARFLAQYHNALLDAREQMEKANRRYRELADHAKTYEVLPSPPINVTQTQLTVRESSLNDSGPVLAVGNNTAADSALSTALGRRKPPVRQAIKPDFDLLSQIRLLQQQLSAAHEREKGLQRQLSKAQHNVPAQNAPTRNLQT